MQNLRGSLLIAITIVVALNGHIVREVDQGQQKIQGYVHQAKYLPIPFKKCFQVETELEANQKYINFKPSSLGLQSLKKSSIKQAALNIGTFEEIRSPLTFEHKDILIFTEYIMVFSAPNRILIVKEKESSFEIVHSYFIEKLQKFQKFKMYKFQNKGFLTVYNEKTVYILNEKDYNDFQLPDKSTLTHFEEIQGKEGQFLVTEFGKGLTHYKINQQTKKIEIVFRYGAKQLGLNQNQLYTMDFSSKYFKKTQSIYILDAQVGIIELSIKDGSSSAKLVIAQKLCESFDSIQDDHFVLLCQSQGFTTIIEAQSYIDKKTKEKKFKKLQPTFHANYLNDLHVGQKYYTVYSHKNIHVFWNTKKNRLPEAAISKSEISLPGLQTFTLAKAEGGSDQMNLYTVQSGELIKYKLVEQKALLTLKSDEPILKNFKIYLYGSCQDLDKNEDETKQVQACKVQKDILLQIVEQNYPRQQDFSISASIIVILIIVFLLVIWICLKKYKGLQRQARKILENYQKKRSNQRRAI